MSAKAYSQSLTASEEFPRAETPFASADAQRGRILLVEDDPANVMVATSFLEIFGYSFDVARNGKDAVEKARTGAYTIVVMDMRMRDMNGMEATQQIREFERKNHRKPLLILCVTANAMVGEKERCLEAGMDDYLAKPYRAEEFQEKLAALQRKNEQAKPQA